MFVFRKRAHESKLDEDVIGGVGAGRPDEVIAKRPDGLPGRPGLARIRGNRDDYACEVTDENGRPEFVGGNVIRTTIIFW